LRAPIDGVVVERNVHKDEMVTDNIVNLFQIADLSRLLVIANCPADLLPSLQALPRDERTCSVRTVGPQPIAELLGIIDEIGSVIDPKLHTAVVKVHVDNAGTWIRAGQYVTVVVKIPLKER
jgi:membrane fusion protein, heavy metal efflux system